jgi:hypothetical protein
LIVTDFDSIWKILEESSRDTSNPGILIRRISPDIPHDIFLGIEKPADRRMLLIRLKKQNVSEFRKLPVFKGFEITEVNIPDDQEKYVTLGLILNDPVFQDIFSTLCSDIFQTALGEPTQIALVRSIRNRLEMWKQFLDIYGFQGLSAEYQRGLYGELRFLRDVLIPLAGIEKAVNSWKGPFRLNPDFQISGIGIEVKTSIAKQHQKIPVASEQQLDDSGLQALYLFHLSIREIDGKGETLPGIINQIRELICSQNGPVNEFEVHLFRAGYLNKHQAKYENRGYVDRESHIFRVIGGFPRIIENDLKNGVGDVQYTIDLSACISFRLNEEEFQSELRRCLIDN